jgi:hypothetical protein
MNDIDDVKVLKDESAPLFMAVKAANAVVIVTKNELYKIFRKKN